ncbi:hypothetical protein BVX98_03295, partial [bacterium F11]
GFKLEQKRNGHSFVTAEKGERYAIRLHNPLPVRVAVNLTVDGINTITGKPSGISDGSKWMINPHSYITIRGWQVDGKSSRRFFFTDKPKSYADWRSKDFDKDLSLNCGVIGAAFFWNKKELQRYYDNHPTYVYTPKPTRFSYGLGSSCEKKATRKNKASGKSRSKLEEEPGQADDQQAGTGMGEKESHPVHHVKFKYDTGMYKVSQAVLIYYDFPTTPSPNPFPGISYAPEMPY